MLGVLVLALKPRTPRPKPLRRATSRTPCIWRDPRNSSFWRLTRYNPFVTLPLERLTSRAQRLGGTSTTIEVAVGKGPALSA